MLDTKKIQQILKDLGYYKGQIDGNFGPMSRAALKHFQSDKKLSADGIYGPASDAAMSKYMEAEKQGMALTSFRTFRITSYYLIDQSEFPGSTVPIVDSNFNVIAHCSPLFFAHTSLEGTGRLTDGRLINVAGMKPTHSHDWDAVLATCKQIFSPAHVGYGGVAPSADQSTVTGVQTFYVIDPAQAGVGYGLGPTGIAYNPFKSVAADVGRYWNSDPRFRGTGGLVPYGTKFFMPDMLGEHLPDGTIHDGWLISGDCGAAIYGSHLDLFSGTTSMSKTHYYPNYGSIYFAGIEQRVPVGYSYGLIPS